MGRFATVIIWPVFVFAFVACGEGQTPQVSTPRPDPETATEPVTPPDTVFEVPVSESPWAPVRIGAGNGRALAKKLSSSGTIAMLLPSSSSIPALEDRVFSMVKAAAPKVQVVSRNRAALDQLLTEKGELPYRTTLEPAGTDILGRPYYLPVNHPLRTEWLNNKTLLKGAKGMLVVQPIRVDDPMIRELRKGRRGGCQDLFADLDAALDRGSAFFRPYEQVVNRILQSAFARHLEVALPYWRDELERNRSVVAPGSVEARCVDAYWALLEDYSPCVDGMCATTPHLHLTRGGIIGMDDKALTLPRTCPVPGMWNYAEEIDRLARRAVRETLSDLDGGWISELLRYSGLWEIKGGMEKLCAPRHRRVVPEDLDAARDQLTAYLSELARGSYSGAWEPAQGLERVPGVGPKKVLARVHATGANPAHDAAAVIKKTSAIDRCDDRRERLFQTILIDVGTSEVTFMGIFFEEELLCEGMPPFSLLQ